MKAICLVVVEKGFASVYEPLHVDCRVIDLDDLREGGKPIGLPADIGFEELVQQAGLVVGMDCVIVPSKRRKK